MSTKPSESAGKPDAVQNARIGTAISRRTEPFKSAALRSAKSGISPPRRSAFIRRPDLLPHRIAPEMRAAAFDEFLRAKFEAVALEKGLAGQARFKISLASPRALSRMPRVKVEHFALQVSDPVAMADWYVEHLGCSVARSGGPPINGRFLLDSAGSVMLEIYRNPAAAVPDFYAIDPLWIHLALVSDHPAADRDRLIKAGAQLVEDLTITPAGDEIVMLRDPWGIAVQLVKRAQPMVWEG